MYIHIEKGPNNYDDLYTKSLPYVAMGVKVGFQISISIIGEYTGAKDISAFLGRFSDSVERLGRVLALAEPSTVYQTHVWLTSGTGHLQLLHISKASTSISVVLASASVPVPGVYDVIQKCTMSQHWLTRRTKHHCHNVNVVRGLRDDEVATIFKHLDTAIVNLPQVKALDIKDSSENQL